MIAGTGDLGQEFAKRVKAMGAHTIGIRRRIQESVPYFDELHTMEEMCNLLPHADVVVLALPSTERTRGCFGSEQLACMKKTASEYVPSAVTVTYACQTLFYISAG